MNLVLQLNYVDKIFLKEYLLRYLYSIIFKNEQSGNINDYEMEEYDTSASFNSYVL